MLLLLPRLPPSHDCRVLFVRIIVDYNVLNMYAITDPFSQRDMFFFFLVKMSNIFRRYDFIHDKKRRYVSYTDVLLPRAANYLLLQTLGILDNQLLN